jgi:hypothetical protein
MFFGKIPAASNAVNHAFCFNATRKNRENRDFFGFLKTGAVFAGAALIAEHGRSPRNVFLGKIPVTSNTVNHAFCFNAT